MLIFFERDSPTTFTDLFRHIVNSRSSAYGITKLIPLKNEEDCFLLQNPMYIMKLRFDYNRDVSHIEGIVIVSERSRDKILDVIVHRDGLIILYERNYINVIQNGEVIAKYEELNKRTNYIKIHLIDNFGLAERPMILVEREGEDSIALDVMKSGCKMNKQLDFQILSRIDDRIFFVKKEGRPCLVDLKFRFQ